MSEPVVACIVEGHGEVRALPVLVRRIALVVWEIPYVEVLTPVHRVPLGRMLRSDDLAKAVQLQRSRIGARAGGVLLVADADASCPLARRADLATSLGQSTAEIAVAVQEYEAWLLAGLGDSEAEVSRDAKGRLGRRLNISYSPTIDQPRLSAAIDVQSALSESASFRRLVRALAAVLGRDP